jgi:quercetin dioxygenase-like cupin family protein
MKIKHSYDVPAEIPSLEGTKDCTRRWLFTDKDGADHYAMRLFELKPGGLIPVHMHEDSEHEIYILEGEAVLNTGENKIIVKKDDAIFIRPGDKHSFINNSNRVCKFICVIPL